MATEQIAPRDVAVGNVIERKEYAGPFPITRRYTVKAVHKIRRDGATKYKIRIERNGVHAFSFTVTPHAKLTRVI